MTIAWRFFASVCAPRFGGHSARALAVAVVAAAFEHRTTRAGDPLLHKQEIVAALIARHIDTTGEGLEAVRALVEE